MNALSTALLQELKRAAATLAASETGAVVLTGDGKAFVAGADIAEMQEMDARQAREYGRLGQSACFDFETLPQPVIAAVNGYALGGGCELAMACDIRIASETALFGQPEVALASRNGRSPCAEDSARTCQRTATCPAGPRAKPVAEVV
jgi:enoyl-CoA hydratase